MLVAIFLVTIVLTALVTVLSVKVLELVKDVKIMKETKVTKLDASRIEDLEIKVESMNNRVAMIQMNRK